MHPETKTTENAREKPQPNETSPRRMSPHLPLGFPFLLPALRMMLDTDFRVALSHCFAQTGCFPSGKIHKTTVLYTLVDGKVVY
jgi:hypothetical protein